MTFDLARETARKSQPKAGPLVVRYSDNRVPGYKQYISSPEWRSRRARYFKSHSQICECCRSKERIELHHKTYARIGHEKDGDLVALCQTCHAGLHDYHRRKQHLTLVAATDQFLHLLKPQPKKKRKQRSGVSSETRTAIREFNEQQRFVPARRRKPTEADRLREEFSRRYDGIPIRFVNPNGRESAPTLGQ